MSKRRLVITAVVTEGRSQVEVAQSYGVSKGWVSKLVARYQTEGEAAFEPRSRRPKTNPNATPAATLELMLALRRRLTTAGLDAGPDTICWHLWTEHKIRISPATVSRQLVKAGLVTPEPAKRPKSSYIRFEADQPNETWQSDFTHYPLTDGTDTEILTWLDDHARYALDVTAHRRVTGPIVLTAFQRAVDAHGIPALTLTDNGMVFTTRLAGGKGGRNALEHELRRLNIKQKNSRPNHPTTCGKVERFQQTMKKWLRAQPNQPATITQLQTLLDEFVDEYNNRRRTAPCPTTPPQPPPTRPGPKPPPPTAAPSTPTAGSDTTASTPAASSPCASTAAYTTSASAEPTPEPT